LYLSSVNNNTHSLLLKKQTKSKNREGIWGKFTFLVTCKLYLFWFKWR